MRCSPPDYSVRGISQARILKWVTFPSPGDFPYLRIEPEFPALAGGFFITDAFSNETDFFSYLQMLALFILIVINMLMFYNDIKVSY